MHYSPNPAKPEPKSMENHEDTEAAEFFGFVRSRPVAGNSAR